MIHPRETMKLFLASLLLPKVDAGDGNGSLTTQEYNVGITYADNELAAGVGACCMQLMRIG